MGVGSGSSWGFYCNRLSRSVVGWCLIQYVMHQRCVKTAHRIEVLLGGWRLLAVHGTLEIPIPHSAGDSMGPLSNNFGHLSNFLACFNLYTVFVCLLCMATLRLSSTLS